MRYLPIGQMSNGPISGQRDICITKYIELADDVCACAALTLIPYSIQNEERVIAASSSCWDSN